MDEIINKKIIATGFLIILLISITIITNVHYKKIYPYGVAYVFEPTVEDVIQPIITNPEIIIRDSSGNIVIGNKYANIYFGELNG